MKEGNDLKAESQAALRLIQGDRIDPGDVDDSEEELEALAVRLVEDQTVLDKRCPVTKLDKVINSLRDGFNIMEQWANAGNRYELPAVVNVGVRAYIERVEDQDPVNAYKFLAKNDATTIEFLAKAMFSAHLQDLIADNPSAAWADKEVIAAVTNGLAHSADVVRAIFPAEPGEDPASYRRRLIEHMNEAVADISAMADTVEI